MELLKNFFIPLLVAVIFEKFKINFEIEHKLKVLKESIAVTTPQLPYDKDNFVLLKTKG